MALADMSAKNVTVLRLSLIVLRLILKTDKTLPRCI